MTRMIDPIRAAVGDIFGAIQAGDVERAERGIRAAFALATRLGAEMQSQFGSLLRMLAGPQIAQQFRSQADAIRDMLDDLRRARLTPMQRLAEDRAALSAALSAFGGAVRPEERLESAARVQTIAQRLLQQAAQFAAGSVQRLGIERLVEQALDQVESQLRAQASAEERRLSALLANTQALARLTRTLESSATQVRRPAHRTGRLA